MALGYGERTPAFNNAPTELVRAWTPLQALARPEPAILQPLQQGGRWRAAFPDTCPDGCNQLGR